VFVSIILNGHIMMADVIPYRLSNENWGLITQGLSVVWDVIGTPRLSLSIRG
jgi:hypothetical protein